MTKDLTLLSNVIKSIDEYFVVKSQISSLASDRGDQDAERLIQLRRDLSQKSIELQQAVGQCVRKYHLDKPPIPELIQHAAMFSAERRSDANHQAKWCAPLVQRDRQGYEAQHKELFSLHKVNHLWRKQVLIPAFDKAIRQQRLGLA